jgi:hypothetical protein
MAIKATARIRKTKKVFRILAAVDLVTDLTDVVTEHLKKRLLIRPEVAAVKQ